MNLTQNQRAVLKTLRDYGRAADDATLAVLVHSLGERDMSSSGARTRRCELTRKGLVSCVGERKMRSGRAAATHKINSAGRKALRA